MPHHFTGNYLPEKRGPESLKNSTLTSPVLCLGPGASPLALDGTIAVFDRFSMQQKPVGRICCICRVRAPDRPRMSIRNCFCSAVSDKIHPPQPVKSIRPTSQLDLQVFSVSMIKSVHSVRQAAILNVSFWLGPGISHEMA